MCCEPTISCQLALPYSVQRGFRHCGVLSLSDTQDPEAPQRGVPLWLFSDSAFPRALYINRDPSFVSMGTPLELPRSAQLLSMPPYPEAPQPGHSLGPHLRSRLVPHAWVVTEGVPQAPTGTVLSWGLRRRHPPHPSHQGMSVWLSVDSAPDAPIPQALPRPVPQSPLSP